MHCQLLISGYRVCVYYLFVSPSRIAHWTEEGACLVILPTSRYCGPGGVSFKFTSDNVAVYQYSDHSSFSELHHFVKAVSPKKIAPIVQFKGVSASRNNMDVFKPYLNSEPLVRAPVCVCVCVCAHACAFMCACLWACLWACLCVWWWVGGWV